MTSQMVIQPSPPESIVSTDAIEPLGPGYGRYGQEFEQLEKCSRRRAYLSRSHVVQQTITAVPLALGDMLAVLGSFFAATFLVAFWAGTAPAPSYFLEGIVIFGVFVGVGMLFGLYPATGASPVFEMKCIVQTTWFAFGTLIFAEKTLAHLSAKEFWGAAIGGCVASVTVPIVRNIMRYLCSKTRWWGETALVVGSGRRARAIYRFYHRSPQLGLRLVGTVGPKNLSDDTSLTAKDPVVPHLGTTHEIGRLIARHRVHWGIIAPDCGQQTEFAEASKHCSEFRNVIVIPAGISLPSLWTSSRECAGATGFYFRDNLRSPIARAMKRTVDIVGALFGLLISAPFLFIAIVWIKAKSPGPAFYGQNRVGKNGRIFRAWKFRTMVTDADEILDHYLEKEHSLREEWMTYQKLKNDPRVIPSVGHFLRSSSLDELPQLWNVFKGDMSLVGPRPCMRNQIELYGDSLSAYLRIRPGLTGLWQVSGRNHTSYEQRVKFDLYYVCNWSMWLDAYILIRTVKTLLMREGAY